MKKTIAILLVLFTSNVLFAQMVVVKGKVTGFDKFPLKNIVVKGAKSGSQAITNEQGVYEIVCQPGEKLVFESKSFKSTKRKIENPNDSINVNLVFKKSKKSKEYAVAGGVISEDDLTFALDQLTNKNHDFETYSDIYDLLVGRFAGVEVQGKSIIIRGKSSMLADNSALLVVDGMTVTDISHISPSMVKSIDIVKGAATSMYGSRGANGVVVITLKKE